MPVCVLNGVAERGGVQEYTCFPRGPDKARHSEEFMQLATGNHRRRRKKIHLSADPRGEAERAS